MDRRSTLGWIGCFAGTLPVNGLTAGGDLGAVPGRPPLSVEPAGKGRWRIRSWEWREEAWRPVIAQASSTASGIELHGQVAEADRREILNWVAGARA